jgi:amidase
LAERAQHFWLLKVPEHSMEELFAKTAGEILALLRQRQLSPLDCLDVLEKRISAVDVMVNALPTLCFDRARAAAKGLLQRPMPERGVLCGLPVVIKDLADVAGVRSTQGSPIFASRVAQSSDILVENLEANGAIVYAMSNTPEFGAGANTFNAVFGRTLNPWNTKRSAAGSSGGAAAALASGMAWLAHGSDLGGSLRNPASFCGIVGLRPSPGRVAASVHSKIDGTLAVEGPMARNVEDVALMLDAMTGEHPADPTSLPRDGTSYLAATRSGWKPKRVAISRDLGMTPVEPVVASAVLTAARRLEAEGVIVEETHPDLSEAHDCFQTLRALGFATGLGSLLETHRDQLKPEVIWNIEKGLSLTVAEIARAERQRAAMFHRMLAFFKDYDLLLCPATIAPPFPIEQRYLEQCNGVRFDNYIEWLAIAYAITLLACPAISIPMGFTGDGLPLGLQIVAPPRAEARLLAGAKFAEDVIGLGKITPIDPRKGK